MSMVTSSAGFIVCRCLIGFSLVRMPCHWHLGDDPMQCKTICVAYDTTIQGAALILSTRALPQACFVCCQYWCTAMFSPNVVGTANAFAGGWGNLGGGATQLVHISNDAVGCCVHVGWHALLDRAISLPLS